MAAQAAGDTPPARPSRLLRWQRRRRFPRPVEPTPGGWWFLGITFAVGVAAINTGNNLLYLVLGMLLALILASGVLSHLVLLRLTVRRELPGRAFAGTPALVGLEVDNAKRRIPSWLLEVEDLAAGEDVPRTGRRCLFLSVAARSAERATYRYAFPRRGRHTLAGHRIATRFPFGLFVKYVYVDAPAELLVYPAIAESGAGVVDAGGRGEERLPRRGRHGEFFAARELRPGEDASDIHWRLSARLGRPVVREREDEGARRVTLELDNGLADDAPETLASFEAAVSTAAGLALAHLGRGESVAIITRGDALPFGAGPAHAESVLRFLALVPAARPETPLVALEDRARGARATHADLRMGHRA